MTAVASQTMPLQQVRDRGPHMLAGKGRDLAVENDAETIGFDRPSHHVERIRPAMFAGGLHRRDASVARALRPALF
jgi:hypothetical protein